MLEHMHGTSFDWLTWSGGCLKDLGIQYNELHIKLMRRKIRKYAIGYCKGESVICRPKVNKTAVMFLRNGVFFGTHLTNKEFEIIFKD